MQLLGSPRVGFGVAAEQSRAPAKRPFIWANVFFLLRAPAAALRLEGSGGSADFCGVFGEYLSRDGFIWSSCGREVLGWALRLCSLQPAAASGRHGSPGEDQTAAASPLQMCSLWKCDQTLVRLQRFCSALTTNAAGWAASNGLKCASASLAGTLAWALHPHDH